MQLGIDFNAKPIPVNPSVDPVEAVRLSKQSEEILERLRQGPATNVELACIGIRYSARIGELRSAGYQVEITHRNRSTGVNVYRLKGEVRK
jgi:hypothetical protein